MGSDRAIESHGEKQRPGLDEEVCEGVGGGGVRE